MAAKTVLEQIEEIDFRISNLDKDIYAATSKSDKAQFLIALSNLYIAKDTLVAAKKR